jgi:hypothetical protein
MRQSGFSLLTRYHTQVYNTFPSRFRSALWSVPAQRRFSVQVKERLLLPQTFQPFFLQPGPQLCKRCMIESKIPIRWEAG